MNKQNRTIDIESKLMVARREGVDGNQKKKTIIYFMN